MRILYAEDERQLSMAVEEIMHMEGYDVDAVYDGREAMEHLNRNTYDAVILDIMMPKADGIEVLSDMRSKQDYTPVLLLTAKTQVEDRIEGLKVGADDYLGKPFDMREFLARLESMIRRSTAYQDTILSAGNLVLNCKTYELTSDISTLQLSSAESNLLAHFLKKPDNSYTIEELREQVFPGKGSDSMVRLYLSYLRNKMKQLHCEVSIIEEEGKFRLQ